MNLIKSFLLIFLGILLIASVSAATQTYAEYSDRSNSATITQGQSISFNAGFYASSPMTVNLKLYTSNYQLVHTFENNKAINTITNPTSFYKYKFSSTYSVTPSKYVTTGSYFIILSSTDASGSQSEYTLDLRVNPSVPTNHAPIITSSPITSVDENTAYAYNVDATDADGDFLTYSLTQNPLGFSINSATGLITGTAPSVTPGTTFIITVQVSDGITSTSQTYTLAVNDISSNNPPLVISTPVTSVDENTAYAYNVDATDADGDFLTYSLTQNPLGFSINSA
ncbi:MAG: putative Ig domain-containing protein, partial [Nanoarchaeota archaeon]|nr:putative Ig domain-containing protein [Nanoarchaeota archaeon]